MLYRLLRSNRETGPFTALQLKEMGLKPYDLLWTEGRGAAWQYASEIPELKDFAPLVEEQPFDRFYKRQEALHTAQQPTVAVKKTKPRFRISNGQLIMIEAGNMEIANTGAIIETAGARSIKEPIAVKEKTAVPEWDGIHTQWQPQTKVIKAKEPVEVETKYSESLDDLKKRYAEKVLNEKVEKPSLLFSASVKQNIMAAVALIVLSVGGYIGYTLKQKDAIKTDGKPLVEKADVTGDNTLSSQPSETDNTAANTAGNTPPAEENSNRNKSNAPVKTASIEAGKITAAATFKKDNTTALLQNTPKKEIAATVKTPLSTNPKTVDKTTLKKEIVTTGNTVISKPLPQQPANNTIAKNTTAGSSVSAPTETKPVIKQNAPKQIGDYLSVKKLGGSGSSIQNVRLLVNNITDIPIDLAVIDIQYYDAKGKFQKGETMYVKNIDGGNNVEVHVPDSDKSSSIKYKVSLVSSEKKTLYIVAD